jgi:hypothetical protein
MGKTSIPAVMVVIPKKSRTFVSKRFAVIRQTTKTTANSINNTDTCCFIFPVFYVVFWNTRWRN